MKIYDCFMYFDEDLILELRFNILDKFVDKFVIIEATRDHSGKKKNLNFNLNKFKKFKKKIIYLVVNDIPKEVKNYKKKWSPNFYRENFNRNAISRALTECNPNDLIIISDADEIPNPKIFDKLDFKKFALLRQKEFIYKLNLSTNFNWIGSGICYKKFLKSPQWLRNKRFTRRGFFRRIFFKTKILEEGGWHFSYLKTPDDISKKLKAYAHSEFAVFADANLIKKNIENKTFFIDQEKKLEVVPIDDSYPEYIKKNKNDYSEWIYDYN